MRAKDKCPSCFQPIAPSDFLCPNCELILDPSQMPAPAVGDVSVVRRMLEPPQRGVPVARPDVKAELKKRNANDGLEGPTRRLDLGPELSGVPVVVATLSRKSEGLTELEAWLVSLIDGLSDANALAAKAGLKELELRVMLRTLNEKQIIDFADEPLSDDDLQLPEVVGTLDEDEPGEDAPAPQQSYGANVDRRDSRFVAPMSQSPARGSSAVPPPPPPSASPPRAPARPPAIAPRARFVPPELEQEPPIVAGRVEPPVLTPASKPAAPVNRHVSRSATNPPYPGMKAEPRAAAAPPPQRREEAPPAPVAPPPAPSSTDSRIAYDPNKTNRKVLDALKQVKRVDGPGVPRGEEKQPLADVLARDSLQVALRMEQNGRMDEAIRFLERSIGNSPDAASLYNRLGIILMRERGDYRRAEQMIRKATELAPDNTVYATNLKSVLQKHAMKQHR